MLTEVSTPGGGWEEKRADDGDRPPCCAVEWPSGNATARTHSPLAIQVDWVRRLLSFC